VSETSEAPARVGSSVLSAIGRTPPVELSHVARDLDGRILAKLEYLNPGGSKKDRIALRMIEDAERSGELQPGQPSWSSRVATREPGWRSSLR
jgi:cysteine synthase